MATSSQECLTIYLKFYRGKSLLSMIDHTTQLSASTFIPSKEPKDVMNFWKNIQKTLTDNKVEFSNTELIDMCEAMNINVKLTAAKSPFSNGLNKQHNLIIADMLDKIKESFEHSCFFPLSISMG